MSTGLLAQARVPDALLAGALLLGLATVAILLVVRPSPGVWQPRVTPGILAEVHLVMTPSGHVSVSHSKLDSSVNPADVYPVLLERWLFVLGAIGLSLSYTVADVTLPLVQPPPGGRVRAGIDSDLWSAWVPRPDAVTGGGGGEVLEAARAVRDVWSRVPVGNHPEWHAAVLRLVQAIDKR